MDLLLESAGHQLALLVNTTAGRWGPSTPEELWWRSPRTHIVEFIVLHLVLLLFMWLGRGAVGEAVSGPAPRRNPRTTMGQVLGVLYSVVWVLQIFIKGSRPSAMIQLCWLLMPCHLISLGWCYVFLTQGQFNGNAATYVATLCGLFHWGPIAAAAVPDFEDHRYKWESIVFVIHHGALLLTPFYWAATRGVVPITRRFVFHAFAVATWVNIGPYQVVCWLSGLNLNYHILPAPGVRKVPLLGGPYYRYYTVVLLMVSTLALYGLLLLTARLFRAPPFARRSKSE